MEGGAGESRYTSGRWREVQVPRPAVGVLNSRYDVRIGCYYGCRIVHYGNDILMLYHINAIVCAILYGTDVSITSQPIIGLCKRLHNYHRKGWCERSELTK